MTKSWTPERRQRMAEMAKKHQIWQHSTGPKTSKGKAISSQNALKHGLRGGIYRKAATLLAANNKLLKGIK